MMKTSYKHYTCGSPRNIIRLRISSASPSLMHYSAELTLRVGLIRAS